MVYMIAAIAMMFQAGWPHAGADAGGSRYSDARQIDRTNVGQLQVAWTYRTGDVSEGSSGARKSKFEATPILFNDTLFISTPFNRVFALEPATGKLRWSYDPKIDRTTRYSESFVSRGVSAWEDTGANAGTPCKKRIFLGTLDARLIAIDAENGRPCAGFGSRGEVDLSRGVGEVEKGEYQITSPPAIVNGIVVVGSAIGDNRKVNVERGTVRAFDARTGRLRWSWDPLPRSSPAGAGNAWSMISADAARNLVFIPTGSAAPDFYGGERPGDNRYANSVVALRASTGAYVWHFQTVHHDLWDYDVAAQPLLTTVRRDGSDIPAVVVNTKMGHVFVLDRESGTPLFPVEERPVPQSDVPGEAASPTQPFPVLPPPLHPHTLPAGEWKDAQERDFCMRQIQQLRYEGIFTPPSLKGTLIFPGYAGGVNWGSAAADPQRALMITNVNQLPFWVKLIPREQLAERRTEASRIQLDAEFSAQLGTPYGMSRAMMRSPTGNPCVPQPWGKTVAVNLNTGAIQWEAPMATFSLGGPIATAGGLVFVAGGLDQKLRALDIAGGQELWSAGLPAGAQSTPMTYQLANGKQFVVIAAGGHADLPVALGDYIIGYALP